MHDVTLPSRLSARQLASIWKITPNRVSQLITSGRLKRGPDMLIDRDEALAFRAVQISKNEKRVLFQSYGNANSRTTPKILDLTDDLSAEDRELLYGEAGKTTFDPMQEALKRQTSLTELRLVDQKLKNQRAEQRIAREAGELVPRTQVYKDALRASATVQRLLRTLEHEIPTIFVERSMRADVRAKVEGVVNRCLHSIAKYLEKYETDENVASPTSTEPED